MSLHFGLQRLALINSANYDSAFIPLDGSLGLLAGNNVGKTSLVNALQFPLVSHKGRLSFGGHGLEDSLRFYFPNDASYIMVELLTPGGTVVIGCVGAGVSHDFQHFAYAGSLDLTDFCTAEGNIVRQASLEQQMATKGLTVFRYRGKEYRDRLFCLPSNTHEGEPRFGLFKVKNGQDIGTFQTVFTRVLRLDDLNAETIKRDMLEVYRSAMRSNLDFRHEWDTSFAAAHLLRDRLQAAIRSSANIELLAQNRDKRIELRTQILHQMERIDATLQGWDEHHFEHSQLLEGKQLVLQSELDSLDDLRTADIERKVNAEVALASLVKDSDEFDNLSKRFLSGHLTTRGDLKAAVDDIAKRRHDLERDMEQGQAASITALERQLQAETGAVASLLKQRDADGATLHAALEKVLPGPVVEGLGRVFSHQAMTLGEGEFDIDTEKLLSAVEGRGDEVSLSGVRFNVSGLPSQYDHQSIEEIDQDIGLRRGRVQSLERSLASARDRLGKEAELADLVDAEGQARHRLELFSRFEALQVGESERSTTVAERKQDISKLSAQITSMTARKADLTGKLVAVQEQLRKLADDEHRIKQLQGRRLERSSPRLSGMQHKETDTTHIVGLPKEVPVAGLRLVMEVQHQRCVDLDQAERESENLLADIHREGLTVFAGEGGSEEEIVKIIRYHENRASEELVLAKETRAAIGAVSSALSHLRDSLRTFEAKIAGFNRLITKQKISDLSVFRINVVPDARLVEDIDTVLAGIDSDSQQMNLLGGTGGMRNDPVARAIADLLEQHELKLSSLFSLDFEIGKQGHPAKKHRQLRGSASDGTTAMARLVIGLALLAELRDPSHDIRATCYLDEAAKLDEANQKALIDVADGFGFSLVMAAPAALTTPAYCIPIDTVGSRNRISESRWITIHQRETELLSSPEALAEATA